jgi:hypothetical protein
MFWLKSIKLLFYFLENCNLALLNLGTHMLDGERRKPIDIEVCRSKVKVTSSKNRTII